MGQVALGIRSLLVRVVIFVIMAALLAWALGGTLWPRAATAETDRIEFAGRSWWWMLKVGGGESAPARVRWQLIVTDGDGRPQPYDERLYRDAAGAVVADGSLFVAGKPMDGSAWTIEQVDGDGRSTAHPMPDRLAVEQQMARIRAGLPLQDRATIDAQRPALIDPAGAAGG